ncbi:hypothetical protein DMT42_34125 [Streptomyces actuosus]|uniref:Uncharacterized protein n=1 Tax=Streptomyces actuosus TaxID=1885 RepID=A0A2U9PD29_STRAS|nr:hypothetical protein DMT42_34125 [Streptomyces actuosus]
MLQSGGLRRSLRVSKVKRDEDMLSWDVFIEDEMFCKSMKSFGGVGVEIWRPDHTEKGNALSVHLRYLYPWPKGRKSLDSVLVRDIREFALPSLEFVQDRQDLGCLLLASDDVHRGKVWARLPSGNEPARLVKAFIIARQLGDSGLEEKAWEKLRRVSESDISWESGVQFLFRQAVADWARQYARKVNIPLDDLIQLKRRRP